MQKLRLLALLGAFFSMGATYQTENFHVEGRTSVIARETAEAAERYREQLATDWFGGKLPNWKTRCRMTVRITQTSPSGSTSYRFVGREIRELEIRLQGPFDQVIDSVLPHELTHAVFASKLGRDVPLWADEGAATLAEDAQQQLRQKLQSAALVKGGDHMSMRRLLARRESGFARREMSAVYVQGFSLVEFLVHQQGKRHFALFLDGFRHDASDSVVKQSYGFQNLEDLEQAWLKWVAEGNAELERLGRQRWVSAAK